jgi:uncharacterized SAM-binding protein YcdF (DUF218 family)
MFLLYAKTIIKNLLLPPAGLLLLALAGWLLLKRRPVLGRSIIVIAIGALWLLSTPGISFSLARLTERYPPLDLHSAADVQSGAPQAIVILGGGGQRAFAAEYGGPAAGGVLLERLSYGAFLARTLNLPVLVTGFRVEAIAMRDSLARNFDIQARWVDADSYDTFENALNSARLLKADHIQNIVLVTHSVHMRRSVEEFAATGLQVRPAPTGIIEPSAGGWVPGPDALLRSYSAINELIGEQVRVLLEATHLRSHRALDQR